MQRPWSIREHGVFEEWQVRVYVREQRERAKVVVGFYNVTLK